MDRGPVATPADDASQGKDALRRARAELLHGGLESMPVIQQAMGIVMAQHRCAPGEALDALLWDAQLADVKVSVLAAEMVRTRAAATTGDSTMPPILD